MRSASAIWRHTDRHLFDPTGDQHWKQHAIQRSFIRFKWGTRFNARKRQCANGCGEWTGGAAHPQWRPGNWGQVAGDQRLRTLVKRRHAKTNVVHRSRRREPAVQPLRTHPHRRVNWPARRSGCRRGAGRPATGHPDSALPSSHRGATARASVSGVPRRTSPGCAASLSTLLWPTRLTRSAGTAAGPLLQASAACSHSLPFEGVEQP